MSQSLIHEEQKEIVNPPDDCAVVGVYSPEKKAFQLSYQLLTNLVHRGTDSNGISVLTNDWSLQTQKGLGKPHQVDYQLPDANLANGHNRYTTAAETNATNAQPFEVTSTDGRWKVSQAHNGNVSPEEIQAVLQHFPEGTSDSALMAQLIVESQGDTWEEKIYNAYSYLNGSFSNVLLTDQGMYAFRDRRGNRPLWLSTQYDGTVTISSETHAVEQLDNGDLFEHSLIQAGELIHVDTEGTVTRQWLVDPREQAYCAYETGYMEKGKSRTANIYLESEGVENDTLRRAAGKQLAQEEALIDFGNGASYAVSSIPNGGIEFANGFILGSGLDSVQLLEKVLDERSFISKGEGKLEVAKKKLHVRPDALQYFIESGKTDLVLVDDSMIRGTMLEPTLDLVRQAFAEAGATAPRIHIRIGMPKVQHPCGLGLAIMDEDELFYNKYKNPEEELGIASIQHLSTEGMLEAFTGKDPREELQRIGIAGIAMGYCFNCMRLDGFVHPIEWYNK